MLVRTCRFVRVHIVQAINCSWPRACPCSCGCITGIVRINHHSDSVLSLFTLAPRRADPGGCRGPCSQWRDESRRTHPLARAAVGLCHLVGLAGMLGPFSIDTYLPAFSGIAASLQATPVQMQQTLSAYLFGFAFMSLFHGADFGQCGAQASGAVGVDLFCVGFCGVRVGAKHSANWFSFAQCRACQPARALWCRVPSCAICTPLRRRKR